MFLDINPCKDVTLEELMKEAYHFHSNPAAIDSALFNISIYFKSLFLPPQFSQV